MHSARKAVTQGGTGQMLCVQKLSGSISCLFSPRVASGKGGKHCRLRFWGAAASKSKQNGSRQTNMLHWLVKNSKASRSKWPGARLAAPCLLCSCSCQGLGAAAVSFFSPPPAPQPYHSFPPSSSHAGLYYSWIGHCWAICQRHRGLSMNYVMDFCPKRASTKGPV